MSDLPPDSPTTDVAPPVTTSMTPFGGDSDVDPDLERLATPRPRRSPVAAIAVITVGALLLVHLAPDLRYATSEQLPVELGQARSIHFDEAGRQSALRDNILAATSGLPDYRNALLFEPKGDNYRRSFYRMLGTSGRLWIRADQTSTRHDLSERIVGRLRRFDTLPFADQVRGYYGKLPVSRLLDTTPFQRRARGEIDQSFLSSLVDRSGERVPGVDPATARATVVVDFPDELLVALTRERFAVEEDARREVSRLGYPVALAHEDKQSFEYAVRVEPGKRDALLGVVEQRDFSVRVRHERFVVPLADLAAVLPGGRGLPLRLGPDMPPFYDVVDGKLVPASSSSGALPQGAPPPPAGMEPRGLLRVVPWEQVDSIQLDAPVEIPHDAWVLLEGDLPSEYGWAKALAVLLLLFLAFNAWLLTRSLRGR